MFKQGQQETWIDVVPVGHQLEDGRAVHHLSFDFLLIVCQKPVQAGCKGAGIEVNGSRSIDKLAIRHHFEFRAGNVLDIRPGHLQGLSDLQQIGIAQAVQLHQILNCGAVSLSKYAERFAGDNRMSGHCSGRSVLDRIMGRIGGWNSCVHGYPSTQCHSDWCKRVEACPFRFCRRGCCAFRKNVRPTRAGSDARARHNGHHEQRQTATRRRRPFAKHLPHKSDPFEHVPHLVGLCDAPSTPRFNARESGRNRQTLIADASSFPGAVSAPVAIGGDADQVR